MMATIASIVLVFSLLFGGTVQAAQDSLPNQYLYQVKILSEDFVTNLPLSETQRLHIELNHLSRRIDELASLAMVEMKASNSLLTRLEQHLDRVIRLAAGMEQETMIRELTRIRERLEYQIKALNSISQNDPVLIRAREMLRVRLDWVDLGLREPNEFRAQVRNYTHYQQPPDIERGNGLGPGFDYDQNLRKAGFGPGPSPNPEQEKSEGKYGLGPLSTKTPTPGQGYGPGPTSEEEPPEYGPGPHSAKTPTSGSNSGEEYDRNPTSDPGPNPESGDPGGNASPNQNQGEDTSNGKGSKP